jgi:hypothetical protein
MKSRFREAGDLWTFTMARPAYRTLNSGAHKISAQSRCLTACEAVETRKCLEIRYDDCTRIIEVHRVGINVRGEHILSGWQIRRPTYERVGWKLIDLEDPIDLALTEIPSPAPRPDYRRGAKQFIGIICQL